LDGSMFTNAPKDNLSFGFFYPSAIMDLNIDPCKNYID